MNDIIHPETGEIMSPADMEPGEAPDGKRPEAPGTALDKALHSIVAELPVWITTDAEAKVNDSRKQKYATMKAVMSIVRPIALKHGVRIRQGCEHAWSFDAGSAKGRAVPVFTELRHTASGQFERTTIEIPFTKMDAQAMGSAISYGRRYGLLAALGLTTDEAEDDGEKTKAPDLLGEHEDSTELLGLKDEINTVEDAAKLKEWGEKLKKSGRADNLGETEGALLRKHFTDALRRLLLAPKDEGKKK